jgi:addiction module HigA family antidote
MRKRPIRIGMKPPHPGQFVRIEILDELDLSIAKAAEALGVRAATLSDLVNEKASLSPEMAMRLELAFGVSAQTLLRMQAWCDTERLRARSAELGVTRFEPRQA